MIEELRQHQLEEQQEQERKVLEKIRHKMDRIKASQQKVQNPACKESISHYQGNFLLNSNGLGFVCFLVIFSKTFCRYCFSGIFNVVFLERLPGAEPQAPLACQSPGVSSQGTPRGYHTPISEEEPPRSLLQAPTPCSAYLTVSLDGYLEPQRMSFSSPPASELNPRSAPFY